MSYILCALKKAEKEKQRGSIPDIDQLIASGPAGAAGSRSSQWIAVATVLLLVMAGGLVLLWMQPDLRGAEGQQSDAGVPAETPTAVQTTLSAASISEVEVETVAVETEPVEGPMQASGPSREFLARQKIQLLDVQGVILFDDEPQRSRVFINGESYSSGDLLAEGVVLLEIGEAELLFQLEGQNLRKSF